METRADTLADRVEDLTTGTRLGARLRRPRPDPAAVI
jgi:hypothetical protein